MENSYNWSHNDLFSPMPWPPEILRNILRAATFVPGALATSYDAIATDDATASEEREAMLTAIADSMNVKRSLSLVCKSFNDMMEEYLYEIIIIHHFAHIPSLVKVLRSSRNGKRPPGRWCRRLDLGQVGQRCIRESIDGDNVLLSIIPLCPNVIIFFCRPQTLFPPVAFWRTMILTWASSLLRMEIWGLCIYSDHFELFLRYFRHLEACFVVNIGPPSYTDKNHDDKDVLEDPGDTGILLRYIDEETQALIRHYRKIAASGWPPYDGGSPYELPRLHTLRLDIFPEQLSQFSFPALRFLSANDQFWYNRSTEDVYLRYEEASHACSSSLTHFAHNSPIHIDVWKIFDMFPYLTELDLHVNSSEKFHEDPPREHHNPRYRQMTLTQLRLFDTTTGLSFDASVFLGLLTFVRSRMFPALENVLVVCNERNYPIVMHAINLKEFEYLGVSIDVCWKPAK